MNHRKRRVPKKIRLLLILNAFLLSCIFILGFLLLKRATSTPVADKQETNTSQTVNQQGSTTKWVKQDQPVKIPILMYHAVHTMAPSEEANANLIVAPETFESHLKALKEAGYYTLTPEEAYRALTKNELPEGRKVVWLTFDDGITDFYTIVYPAGRYSDVTMELAKNNGYKMGLTTNNGLASLDDGLYSLKRLRILPSTTAENLLAEMQTNP